MEPINEIPSGVSMESASYMESNNNLDENSNDTNPVSHKEEEHIPKLFSEEQSYQEETELKRNSEINNEQLFDQDTNEDEDFEIPAFLRKQKF